ncbi:MAG: carboxylate--amine ligase [Gammaproteobacteria bacterium]|nr:carboxylate--amine ligase [Gammaproteobacteria bacterium]
MPRERLSSKPAAVVIGLDCITGLQTARLLNTRGVPVVGVATNVKHFAARTNVCQTVLKAATAGEELFDTLETLSARLEAGAVLYPCTDNSVHLLSAGRSRLGDGYLLALPEHHVVEMLMNKRSLYAFAKDRGFRVPGTFEVKDRQALEKTITELRFPCVLKPSLKDSKWLARSTAKAFKAATAEELLQIYDKCADWSEHLIVQEWIEGPESELYSCNVYFGKTAQPPLTFVARKIRQWPPQTGTSCLGVECRADEVRDETVRLFDCVGYRGLGYVEMKRDVRTGEYLLIEPNVGRPTGRSAIAEAGGVELLYTMYCDLIGAALPETRTQTYGNAKWIYLRRDLQAALHARRRGELSAGEWLSSIRGPKTYAVFSLRDPLPFLLDFRRSIGLAISAVIARLKKQKLRSDRVVTPAA